MSFCHPPPPNDNLFCCPPPEKILWEQQWSIIKSIYNVHCNSFRLGIFLGLGCALNFHSGIKLVNHLTSRNNGFANGVSQAGNTMGAIAVSFAVAGYFTSLDFQMSLVALGVSLIVLIPISGCFYWPNKFLSTDVTFETKGPEVLEQKDIYFSYKYYLFIISQTLNAVGFLNFTTYLAAHLHQVI